MPTVITILFVLSLLGGMGSLLFRQIKTIRTQQVEAKRVFQQRLLAPEWEIYATHLQRDVPEAMKQLYLEFALLLSEVEITLENGMTITEFFPLDAQAMLDQKAFQPEAMDFDCLPFATMRGQELFLRPGTSKANQTESLICATKTFRPRKNISTDTATRIRPISRSKAIITRSPAIR